jgi:F-type H+-transporting ATPase subunit delta
MQSPRLAGRYAKSLLDIAKEQGQVETVYEDMLTLQSINKNSRDFVMLLRSPVVTADKKNKVITAVTQGKIGTLTATFIKLLVSKAREAVLPEIITAFIQQYKAFKNIYVVKLTTAAPVSDALKNEIVSRVQQTSNMQNIELEATVDNSLIGGFTLQAGDKLIDASISYDLKQIAKQFENNDFIYKVR